MISSVTTTDLIDAARRIGTSVVAPAAEAVDVDARFPHEAIAALREERMLGAFVPRELGGRGATDRRAGGRLRGARPVLRVDRDDLSRCIRSRSPAWCVTRCPSPFFRDYLAELARREWLIASATSEIGVGGDLRRSICAVERDGRAIRIRKRAPVISYGEEADDILLTARRAPDAAARRSGARSRPQGRRSPRRAPASGTRSGCGAREASASPSTRPARPSRCCPFPFADDRQPHDAADVARPVDVAVARPRRATPSAVHARSCAPKHGAHPAVRRRARCGSPRRSPSSARCARPFHGGLADFERHQDDPETLAGLGFAIRMNNLKTSAASMAPAHRRARARRSAASAAIGTTRRTRWDGICATRIAPR